MLPGYNTNGMAHHRLEDAVYILAELGYRSIALTLDYHALDPFAESTTLQKQRIRQALENGGLRSVIETGARFLLDPWRKHQPTLLSEAPQDRDRRLDFLKRAVDLAADLGSDAVSFWSGRPEAPTGRELLLDRLVTGCARLCEYAERQGVRLAFEPEPGMLIDTMASFAELRARVDHPLFGLTLDLGHLHCQGEAPIAPHVHRWRELLWNIHVEDMRHGVHDHLMFGEGEMDFAPIFRALAEVGYAGGLHVELGRHSHNAVETARRALAFLKQVMAEASAQK